MPVLLLPAAYRPEFEKFQRATPDLFSARAPARTLAVRAVKRETSETADFFGFHDRGRLAPGKRADINVINFDRLRLHPPEVVNDLSAGGKRLVQRAEGYEATLVAGTPVFERGEPSGARPGRLGR